MSSPNQAKLAEMKQKVQREGFKPIPMDRSLWAGYLRDLRAFLGMNERAPFWRLFGVSTQVSSRYEKLVPPLRPCPVHKMEEIAEALGLTFASLNDPSVILKKVPNLPEPWRDVLSIAYQHNLTKWDLEKYVEIRNIINR